MRACLFSLLWHSTGYTRQLQLLLPNKIRKQFYLIKSGCIKCRHLHLSYFLRPTGLIQLELKWISKLKKKIQSPPVSAETFKIRWNNSTLRFQKTCHTASSPEFSYSTRSVIFETSVTSFSSPFCKLILTPSGKGNHKSPLTLFAILAYLQ